MNKPPPISPQESYVGCIHPVFTNETIDFDIVVVDIKDTVVTVKVLLCHQELHWSAGNCIASSSPLYSHLE